LAAFDPTNSTHPDNSVHRYVRASEVPPEDTRVHLAHTGFPAAVGGSTIVVGYKGDAKSTWMAWHAKEATEAGLRVMVEAREDRPGKVRARLDAAGADVKLIHLPETDEHYSLKIPRDIEDLEKSFARHRPDIYVIDPLEAVIQNFTNPELARDAMMLLSAAAYRYDVAVVLLHHLLPKSPAKSVAAAMGGASALRNVARAVWLIGSVPAPPDIHPLIRMLYGSKPNDDERDGDGDRERDDSDKRPAYVLACDTSNVYAVPPSLQFRFETVLVPGIEKPVPRLVADGNNDTTADELFIGLWRERRKNDDASDALAVNEAVEFILNYLS
jgi:AAA domain